MALLAVLSVTFRCDLPGIASTHTTPVNANPYRVDAEPDTFPDNS